MADVTRVLSNHLQLAKESASLLIDMGEGIHLNTTPEEIDFLLKSTLVEESHARNAVLQALQVFIRGSFSGRSIFFNITTVAV